MWGAEDVTVDVHSLNPWTLKLIIFFGIQRECRGELNSLPSFHWNKKRGEKYCLVFLYPDNFHKYDPQLDLIAMQLYQFTVS